MSKLNPVIGSGSHLVEFYHENVGTLSIYTGMDQISWGYELNTANFPTYGGEVVQILSCYVDDLTVQGTTATYEDMEKIYEYFLNYLKLASASTRGELEIPMRFRYPTRGWEFEIIITELPGYRKSREMTATEWMIRAFIVDTTSHDVADLKDTIIHEVDIQNILGEDNKINENFGLEGKIQFIDENPFSDPLTDQGLTFAADQKEAFQHIASYYSTLLPSYLNGDYDAIFNNVGSAPAFTISPGAKGLSNEDTKPTTSKIVPKR